MFWSLSYLILSHPILFYIAIAFICSDLAFTLRCADALDVVSEFDGVVIERHVDALWRVWLRRKVDPRGTRANVEGITSGITARQCSFDLAQLFNAFKVPKSRCRPMSVKVCMNIIDGRMNTGTSRCKHRWMDGWLFYSLGWMNRLINVWMRMPRGGRDDSVAGWIGLPWTV